MESLADPGGVGISGDVHNQVKKRLPLHFKVRGEQSVKNIKEPVKAYTVLSKPGAAEHRVIEANRTGLDKRRKILLPAAVMVLILAAGGVLAWNKWGGPPEAGKEAAREAAPPSLPARPSIAVLAFNNLSDDPRQEFFADGMSEDIITDLSKIKGLFVGARNSSFAYTGKAVDVADVGRKLKVRYILEGSVRRVDERIRVTAQLIDTKTGNHQWAERYDRKMEHVFDIQDEITEEIVAALKVELTLEEADRIRRKTTNNLEAWEHYVRGMNEYHRYLSSTGIYYGGRAPVIARVAFEQALKLDPAFTAAQLGMGWTYLMEGEGNQSFLQATPDPYGKAADLARKVIAQYGDEAEPHALLGQIHLVQRHHDKALEFGRQAVALSPNSADWRAYLAYTLAHSGRPEEALEKIAQATRLDPSPPVWYMGIHGMSLYLTGRYEEAIIPLRTALTRFATPPQTKTGWSYRRKNARRSIISIANYSAVGQRNKAAQLVEALRKVLPNFQPAPFLNRSFPFKDKSVVNKILVDLKGVGVPK